MDEKPGINWKKELVDQPLHVVYGLCLMYGFSQPQHILVAVLLTMTVAGIRELEQHSWDWRVVVFWGKDMRFWFLACCLFAAAKYLFT